MGATDEYWVFGYGSLMWQPGFAFLEQAPATVYGYHRAFCIYSHHYRGTAARPGLVLGLDRGGSCHGVAFRVASEAWGQTHAYLRARELTNYVYLEADVRAHLAGRQVTALTYVADRSHGQYAGGLSLEEQARLITQGIGISGACTDYALATLQHLREAGIHDTRLEALGRSITKTA